MRALHGVCDKRLNESSDYREDVVEWVSCGKSQSLDIQFISTQIVIAFAQLHFPLKTMHRVNKLIVLHVYFPSTDSDPTTFMQCTLELEAILNKYSEEGAAVTLMLTSALLQAPEELDHQIRGASL